MPEPTQSLTDKEKETLRLILRGHDAKSAANHLGLSVHTINERLRAARPKLSVTISREAARVLLNRETRTPEILAYKQLGEAAADQTCNHFPMPAAAHSERLGLGRRKVLIMGGVFIMSIFAISLALLLVLNGADAIQSQADPSPSAAKANAEQEAAAREWLSLVDDNNWQASFDTSGSAFRAPNTLTSWQAASEQARVPLGKVVNRKAVAFQTLYAPPNGYQLVQFKSDFENRAGVVESVTLEREDGVLRVVGYFID
ncbi:MAG: DUF4019 domain-containing protein [Allopontixanthobacter sediminis]